MSPPPHNIFSVMDNKIQVLNWYVFAHQIMMSAYFTTAPVSSEKSKMQTFLGNGNKDG